MKTLFGLVFLVGYAFSTLSCPGTSTSSCDPGIPSSLQIAPGTSITIPLTFNLSCIPSQFELVASAGLHISGSLSSCTLTADASFSGTGYVSVSWCDASGNPGVSNTTCNCLCTAAPTTTPAPTPAPTTPAPTPAPTTTPAPTPAPTTTPAPTPAPTTTPAPTPAPTTPCPTCGCGNGPPSTCALSIPTSVSFCGCDGEKTFSFMLPSCSIVSYNVSWGVDAGLNAVVTKTATSADVTISAQVGVVGSAWIFFEWCDSNGGHGQQNTSCSVLPTPTTTPTPTPTPPPTAPTPTPLPTPSPTPGNCRNGPPSTCEVNFPSELSMCSCEVQTFTFNLPTCGIVGWYFAYTLDAGIKLQVLHNGTDYIKIQVSAVGNIDGYATLQIGWCDTQGGYGSKNVSCHVSPPTSTPTTTVLPTTPSPTPNPQECGPNGAISTCSVQGPTYFSFTVGKEYNFTLTLSCPAVNVLSDWAVTNALCQISVAYDNYFNPTYSVSCGNIVQKASGIIQTKWCDNRGGYVSFTTNFDVNIANVPTLPPPPSGVDSCRHNPRSNCLISGPSVVQIPAGQSYTFSVTLQCPVQSCSTRWTATFGSCLVKVNYRAVNPTYTITAPHGSEGRGGCIVTEWCDRYAGYINWTTNFVVGGSLINVTQSLQQAAQVGVMSDGTSMASLDNSNANWRRTGWVIFLFCLLSVVGCIFLLALLRLAYKRYNKHYDNVPSSAQARRGSDPHTSDFANPQNNNNSDHVEQAVIHAHPSSPHGQPLDP